MPVPNRPVSSANAGRIFVGTSGWAYATWKPGFYPAKTPAKQFLTFYSSRVNSVEVNYTFRTLPGAAMLAGWLAASGPEFRFSFKAPQRITHFSRLRDCESAVAEFMASLEPAAQADRLGLLLFQLPPNFKADAERLRGFLAMPELKGRKIAFEFRHESWFAPPMLDILREHDAALCVAESDDLATPEVHTAAGIACFRLRRNGGYSEAEIAAFAERFERLAAEGREVYAYFKHEDEPTGALNASALLDSIRAGKRG
jgi:uncharacterized protein YecE (DUF72 family)